MKYESVSLFTQGVETEAEGESENKLGRFVGQQEQRASFIIPSMKSGSGLLP